MVAEIFPSVLSIEDDLSGLVHDLAQVRTCVRHAAALDARGRLEEPFGPPPGLSESQRGGGRGGGLDSLRPLICPDSGRSTSHGNSPPVSMLG